MASSNSLFPKGNSINRPPIFNGVGYHYWKTRMQIFIEAIDLNVWDAIEVGPYIPTMVAGSKTIEKLPELKDGELKREVTHINFEEDKLNVATYNIENFSPEEGERIGKVAEIPFTLMMLHKI